MRYPKWRYYPPGFLVKPGMTRFLTPDSTVGLICLSKSEFSLNFSVTRYPKWRPYPPGFLVKPGMTLFLAPDSPVGFMSLSECEFSLNFSVTGKISENAE